MTETADPTQSELDPAIEAESDVVTTDEKPSRLRAFWEEIKGLALLLLAVLAFHSFIAKPFYIPSISMMPNLLVGDRLVVSKYPYGWSFVSPTIPNPAAIFRWLVLRQDEDALAFMMEEKKGRVWGELPERGDIVIFTPKGSSQDWIKRVIGLPGDTIALIDGQVILNGVPVQQEVQPRLMLPVAIDRHEHVVAVAHGIIERRFQSGTVTTIHDMSFHMHAIFERGQSVAGPVG